MINEFRTPLLYTLLVGFFLGALQTGLFFQLTFTLSAGFVTYLLIMICWLLGSALGVYYVPRWNISLRALLLVAFVAYVFCSWLVNAYPFDTRVWVLYAAAIVIIGIYPGAFFARAADSWSARNLFFWENNGFVAGLVISTMLFMFMGRSVLWALPVTLAGLTWLLCPFTIDTTAAPATVIQ